MQETLVRSLDWEDPLKEENATHSSILDWRIPQRSLMGYILWDSKDSDTTEHTCTHACKHQLSSYCIRHYVQKAIQVRCFKYILRIAAS